MCVFLVIFLRKLGVTSELLEFLLKAFVRLDRVQLMIHTVAYHAPWRDHRNRIIAAYIVMYVSVIVPYPLPVGGVFQLYHIRSLECVRKYAQVSGPKTCRKLCCDKVRKSAAAALSCDPVSDISPITERIELHKHIFRNFAQHIVLAILGIAIHLEVLRPSFCLTVFIKGIALYRDCDQCDTVIKGSFPICVVAVNPFRIRIPIIADISEAELTKEISAESVMIIINCYSDKLHRKERKVFVLGTRVNIAEPVIRKVVAVFEHFPRRDSRVKLYLAEPVCSGELFCIVCERAGRHYEHNSKCKHKRRKYCLC